MKQRKYYQMPRNRRKVLLSEEKLQEHYKRMYGSLPPIENFSYYLEIEKVNKRIHNLKQRIEIRYNEKGKVRLPVFDKCRDHVGLFVERRRLNTQYHDDESNYMTSCISCYQEMYDYYEELWADYYSSRL